MARFLRIFVYALTGLSVACSAVLLVLWVRSYVKSDVIVIGKTATGHDRAIRSAHGSLYVGPIHVDPVRKKRFFRKQDSRRAYYLELLALTATPALAHLMAVLIRREARRRQAAAVAADPADESPEPERVGEAA